MKANGLAALLLFLMLAAANAQETNSSSSATSKEAFATLKTKAENGDAKAQFDVGFSYFVGKGVAQDFTNAAMWYRKAAEQGNADAEQGLATMYEFGFGVPKDLEKAESLFWQALTNGNKEAGSDLSSIAQWYLDGNKTFGVSKDVPRTINIYKKLAETGDKGWQCLLAEEYDDRGDLPTDHAEAAKWFRKAAEQGLAEAQCNLGTMYDNGKGVPQDYAEAVKWYRKSADQGFPMAQAKLGIMYEQGEGVPQDYVEAYKWFNLAGAQGITNAIPLRDFLAQSMTPDQIAEAQQLSREFKQRKEGSNNSNSPESPTATGTGFFITDDGYLISNYHVVKDAVQVRLVTSAGTISVKMVQRDAANDLALLKAEGRFAPLPIISSRAVKLGGMVATVGFPDPGLQGFSPKLGKGEIAALAGAGDDARYFQISVPCQPGNSGGALVDEKGDVVGIVSAKLDTAAAIEASGALPENVNYAVKSSFLLSFLESVPDVSAKLKPPNTKEEKFEDVVKSAQDAAVLVLVY